MKKERIILIVLACAMFTHIMDFIIIMPLGPQLMRLFDIKPSAFSLLVSAYAFSAFISGIISAFFIDRFDRKKSFIVIYSGFALGTLACALAPTYWFLIMARSLTGLFGGVVGALVISIVSDLIPLERRAAGIGFVMMAFSVASVFGVPFGLYFSALYSWHFPFYFLGAMAVVVAILTYFIVPNVTGHLEKSLKDHPVDAFKRILKSRNARMGLLFTAMLMLGHFTIIPFIAPYMVGNVGFTEQELSYIYLVGGALTIFTSPWVGTLADRYGRLNIYTLFGLLVIIPVLWITNMGPTSLGLALFVTGIFFVFANGRMVPSTTMVTSVIKPENRGAFMGLRTSVQQLFSGFASLIGGWIVTEIPSTVQPGTKALLNYHYVGYFTVFFTLLALLVARKLKVEKGA